MQAYFLGPEYTDYVFCLVANESTHSDTVKGDWPARYEIIESGLVITTPVIYFKILKFLNFSALEIYLHIENKI
jgi:hypothetical protein